MRISPRIMVPCLALCTFLFSGLALATPAQTWKATAQINGATSTQTPATPSPSTIDDSTGLLQAHGSDISPEMPPIDAAVISDFGLSTGTVAASAAFDATSNSPVDTQLYTITTEADVRFDDDITISSGTLSPGTPVQVRFVFDAALSAGAAASSDVALSQALLWSEANAGAQITPASHRYAKDIATSGLDELGIFSGPQHAEYTLGANVGDTLPFTLRLELNVNGEVRIVNGSNTNSRGWNSVAIAFGGEVVGGNAQLDSALLGGVFPDAASVSPTAALAALPSNPWDVPEPGTTTLASAALLAIAVLRRQGAASRG